MTIQEIYDELGQLGTLMLLFLEMALADGELTEKEIDAVIKSAKNFTNGDIKSHVDKAINFRKSVTTEERINYLTVGLAYFENTLDLSVKNGILKGLTSIAKADGRIDPEEMSFFIVAKNLLKL